ncbi:amino acid adenylation domain-containing protein [Candidatus Albibeggiatoa sp. nov. NOAA]|uniref:amino acid adenylation domain-containing protein n=1 Tax=Candidatus Albibeggiatoa sp. nov. NOAA TaxID=3162724 RepID=UPI0032F663AD|nr:amino acid adenylation domain-containing protein [Thiotrichaceae bacterium]
MTTNNLYPLSTPQKEIWFHQMLYPQAPLYNIGGYMLIEGEINTERCEQAVNLLIQKHDVLRITLQPRADDIPLQSIANELKITLPQQDFSTTDNPEQAAQDWMQQRFKQAFDLHNPPLFEFTIIKVSEQRFYLFNKFHHLLVDGWSIALLDQSFIQLYTELSNEQTPEIHAPSYLDFIDNDRAYAESNQYQKDTHYWRDKYQSLPEPLFESNNQLKDRLPPSECRTVWLPRAFYNQLETFAKAHKSTLFHVMLAATYVYFTRTHRREELAIGMPVLNRSKAAFKQTAGLFVGVSAAWFQLGSELSFSELLQGISKTLKADYRHQRFPISDLNRAVGIHKTQRQQIFDVQLNYAKQAHQTQLAGSHTQSMILSPQQEQIPLAIAIWEFHADEAVQLDFTYNLAYFNPAEIKCIQTRFITLLEAVLAQADAPIHTLPLLSAEEKNRLQLWNQTDTDYSKDQTIVDLFEQQVLKTPDAIAAVCPAQNTQLTYQQLNQQANQLARHLQTLNVQAETLVGICMERSLEMLVGLFGILKAGGAYLPLDPAYPRERLALMLEDAQAPVLLTQSSLQSILPETQAHRVYLDQQNFSDYTTDNIQTAIQPEHLAYVIYTSGSTGRPKGVAIEHHNLASLLAWSKSVFSEDDIAGQLLSTSLNFDVSVFELFVPLSRGGQLIVVDNILALGDLSDDAGIVMINAVPSALRELIKIKPLPASIKVVNLAGEAIPAQLVQDLYQMPQVDKVFNIYGPTEDTVYATCTLMSRDPNEKVTIGKPIDNAKAYILDKHLQRLPIGVAGELHLGGAGVARGYLHRPELNAEKFIPDPFSESPNARMYKTGDLACFLPDGNIDYLGRIDNQVKIRGFRIELGEIETVLNQHVDVHEVVVIPQDMSTGHPHLVAYIVSNLLPDRVAYQHPCYIESQGQKLHFETVDICSGGLCLHGDDLPFEIGQQFNLQLQLPFEAEISRLNSEVRWKRGAEVGLMFHLNPEVQTQLDQSVRDLLEKNGIMSMLQRTLTQRLREHLKDKLPNYMIPSAFVLLQSLPLNPNGKVDRRVLSQISVSHKLSEDRFVAPKTQAENSLTKIWAEVLNRPKVGIEDNFFELGGDSIISIQIVSRARQMGLELGPDQLFEYPTIAELAKHAKQTTSIQTEQGILTGELPLTPIQHWFFQQQLPEAHHFNQAVLLQVSPQLDAEHIEQILQHLLQHHDALRLNFQFTDQSIKQWFAGINDISELFSIYDLSDLNSTEQTQQIKTMADQLQTSFDLQQGALLRMALFKMGDEQPNRLFIVVHHLAIDGVSWRILLEDFVQIYQQLNRDEAINLPPKTSSMRQWAKQLGNYALSDEVNPASWQIDKPIASLPLDNPTPPKVQIALDAQYTQALLNDVPQAYRTQINDVLLTALAQSVAAWTGEEHVLIDLEGHGREDLFSNMDVSRTVGWFTSLFPVHLDLTGISQQLGSALKAVKEQLRSIPNKGIDYGALKYLHPESALSDAPKPQISFNYLGQFQQFNQAPFLGLADEDTSLTRGASNPMAHLIEIDAFINDGELCLEWNYSAAHFQAETIQRVAHDFIQALQDLISHCQLPTSRSYTPSDFPLAQLQQTQLDEFIEQLDDVYPLSPMQQGMLFHTLYEPDSGMYFEQLCLRLQGELNVDAFQTAWQQVTERYAILRAQYRWQDLEQPLQLILPSVNLPWQQHDWRDFNPAQQAQQLQTFLQADQTQGFDLQQAPLIRFALLQLDHECYQLVWSFHHLLLDGWCLSLVLKDVATAYANITQGKNVSFEPEHAYRHYIAWLQQQDKAAAQTFWQQQLADFSAPTSLRADTVVSEQHDYIEYDFSLDVDTSQALRQLAQTQQLTLNTLVQGAWALLLSRYSAESDVVFGATVSGRPADLVDVDTMVGLFINTLPVRVNVSTDTEVLPWLQDLQTQQLQRDIYSFTPLVDIQGWSEIDSGAPLFDSLLVFENYPIDQSLRNMDLGGLSISEVQFLEKTNYPLTLATFISGETISFKLAYATHRFQHHSMVRMMEHLQTLLQGILDTSRQLNQIPMMTADEQQQLLAWTQTTSEIVPTCVHQQFEQQAAATPDAIAVEFAEQSLTYQQLNQHANQLAHYLQSLGVQADTVVGICLERSLDMLVGLLGIFKAGGAYLPLDPNYPTQRLAFMLEDAQLSILVTDSNLRQRLPATTAQIICLDQNPQAQQASTNPKSTVSAEHLAYVIYTSGSTGKPKGVMIEQGGLNNFVQAAVNNYPITQQDRVLQFASINFDAAVEEIFPVLTQGGTLVLRTPDMMDTEQHFLQTCQAKQITVLDLPTAYWQQLISSEDNHPYWPESVKTVIIGGEAASLQRVQQWQQTFGQQAQLLNTYGPTEATVVATYYRVDDNVDNIPIGKPLSNYQTYILDSNQQPVALGIAGELCLAGNSLARGYLGRDDLSAEKFIDVELFGQPERIYRTGDLARWLPDGNLEYLGRIDHQVKLRGFRIELSEIEQALMQHPSVKEAIVLLHDPENTPRLIAYVTLSQALAVEALQDWLKQRLPDYMLPAALMVLDALPLTPNNKIDRKALPAPDALLAKTYQAPRDMVELQLAQLWEQVLNVQPIGIHDNFFTLGGQSLLAVRLMSLIQQQFDRHLPIATLFKGATIAELADVIREQQQQIWPTLIPIQAQGNRSPLFCLPGAGGNVLYLYNLAAHLGQDQPFYGLQPPGLDGKTETPDSIEVLASYHIRELQTAQPHNPYYLVGHCFGGKVAFEMARQLEQQGHTVAMLVILDSTAPSVEPQHNPTADWNETDWLWSIVEVLKVLTETEIELTKDQLHEQADLEQAYELVMQYLKQRQLFFAPDADIAQLKATVKSFKAEIHAQLHYQPQGKIDAPIVLIRAEDQSNEDYVQNADWDWHPFTSSTFNLEWNAGTHFSMFYEPHVESLSQRLRHYMRNQS